MYQYLVTYLNYFAGPAVPSYGCQAMTGGCFAGQGFGREVDMH